MTRYLLLASLIGTLLLAGCPGQTGGYMPASSISADGFARNGEQAQWPTKVYLTGKLSTFDAPANNNTLTGLTMELQSSGDIIVDE